MPGPVAAIDCVDDGLSRAFAATNAVSVSADATNALVHRSTPSRSRYPLVSTAQTGNSANGPDQTNVAPRCHRRERHARYSRRDGQQLPTSQRQTTVDRHRRRRLRAAPYASMSFRLSVHRRCYRISTARLHLAIGTKNTPHAELRHMSDRTAVRLTSTSFPLSTSTTMSVARATSSVSSLPIPASM